MVVAARRTLFITACVVASALGGACSATPIDAPGAVADEAATTTVPAATTTASTTSTTTPPQPDRVTLVFTGDLLPHTAVDDQARAAGAASGTAYDFRPMFTDVAPRLAMADLALCHLEVPLSADDSVISSYPVFSGPRELADAAATAGYDGCSTASNHTLDQQPEGVVATLDVLDQNQLGHSGSARSAEEALDPVLYQTSSGVTVGHVAGAYGFNGYTPDVPWRVRTLDPTSLIAAGQAARQAGADLVVASLHWGVERQHEVTAEQMQLAEQLTASGAFDLIVGHHAHVVQPIMRLHGVPVVFGLGNFLSNMTEPETSDGVIVRVRAVRDPGAARWRTDIALTPTSVDLSTFAIREVAPEDPSWQRTISVMTSAGVGHPSR